MDTWFSRHAIGAINANEHEKLCEADRVAIHYPALDHRETVSLNPTEYDRKSAEVIGRFAELANQGGFIWAQYSDLRRVKIGVIEPKSEVIAWETEWSNPRHADWLGHQAILKTLRLTKTQEIEIEPGELMSLRVARPRQGTLCRWHKIGRRLENLISGNRLSFGWESLSADQLETVVSEFLRSVSHPEVPRLRFLLLPPGRTMQDVDIYGVAEDGRKLFAQVTFRGLRKTDAKLARLEPYARAGSHALFFCAAKSVSKRGPITIVPNDLVDPWLRSQEPYTHNYIDECNRPVLP